jgi:hypothetical protein
MVKEIIEEIKNHKVEMVLCENTFIASEHALKRGYIKSPI